MDLLLRLIKIGTLLALILVLAVLLAPTLNGPFVVIHFSTALRAWVFAQLVILAFAIAAAFVIGRAIVLLHSQELNARPNLFGSAVGIAPLRC